MAAAALTAVPALQMVGFGKYHQAIFKVIVFIGFWFFFFLCHVK